jgi:hypothetical protein
LLEGLGDRRGLSVRLRKAPTPLPPLPPKLYDINGLRETTSCKNVILKGLQPNSSYQRGYGDSRVELLSFEVVASIFIDDTDQKTVKADPSASLRDDERKDKQ